MSPLPPPLAPWAKWLEKLSFPDLEFLDYLVRRIDSALGPDKTPSETGRGEFDGFAGVDLKGQWRHLLATQFVLADEFPEEFLRRATSGELMYFKPARKEPRGDHARVVVVDVGPSQMGAPRLVHAAFWMVMYLRARAANQRLICAALQTGYCDKVLGAPRTAISSLLHQASPREPVEYDFFQAWTRIGLETFKNYWIIGGPAIDGLGPKGPISRIRLVDPLDLDGDRLLLQVTQPNSRPAEITLDLPDEDTSLRILQAFKGMIFSGRSNPRAHPRRGLQRHHPASNLVFSSSGDAVFCLNQAGELLAIRIPPTNARGFGRPSIYPPAKNCTILAADLHLGKVHFLESLPGKPGGVVNDLTWSWRAPQHFKHPVQFQLNLGFLGLLEDKLPGDKGMNSSLGLLRVDKAEGYLGNSAFLLLPGASLLLLKGKSGLPGHLQMEVMFQGGPAPGCRIGAVGSPSAGNVVAVCSQNEPVDSDSRWFLWQLDGKKGWHLPIPSNRVAFGFYPPTLVEIPDAPGYLASIAIPENGGSGHACDFDLHLHGKVRRIRLEAGKKHLGPAFFGDGQDGPGLLFLDPLDEFIKWTNGSKEEILFHVAGGLDNFALCPVEPLLACVTGQGETLVYCLKTGRTRFHQQSTGEGA